MKRIAFFSNQCIATHQTLKYIYKLCFKLKTAVIERRLKVNRRVKRAAYSTHFDKKTPSQWFRRLKVLMLHESVPVNMLEVASSSSCCC